LTTTFPIDLPTSPAPKAIRYTPVAINSMTRSMFSGEQQVLTFGVGWWEAEIVMPPMTEDKARIWSAAIQSLNGRQGTFNLTDPVHPQATNADKVLTGPTIHHPSGAGNYFFGNSLQLAGWTPSQPALAYGDWFTIAGLTGLHRVQNASVADGSGIASIEFWPTVRDKAFHGVAVTVINAKGIFRLQANDGFSFQWDERQMEMGLGFKAYEAL
jgi:hypothetical protein